MSNYLYQLYHFFHMDTVFTIQLASQRSMDKVEVAQVSQALHQTDQFLKSVEESLSAFLETSSLSRYRRREPVIDDKLATIIGLARHLEEKSGYLFHPHDERGFNPTSFVKGWAVEEVVKGIWTDLVNQGVLVSIILNGGGDMFCFSQENNDFEWKVTVAPPNAYLKMDKVISLRQGGVATSGKSQRGNHFWNGKSNSLAQITLVGQSLVDMDAWSTLLMTLSDEEVGAFIREHALTATLVTNDNQILQYNGGLLC
ncbi:TPA: FAD:protein FMN transferase [Streptococcus suis]